MLSSQQEDCRLQLLCELGVPSLIEAVILLRRYQLEGPDTVARLRLLPLRWEKFI